jgi:large subunit ribosomal protein L29
MADTKATQLRDKTAVELEEHALKLRRDLFDISFQHATRQLEDTASVKKARRELARTLTVLKEKQRAEAAQG